MRRRPILAPWSLAAALLAAGAGAPRAQTGPDLATGLENASSRTAPRRDPLGIARTPPDPGPLGLRRPLGPSEPIVTPPPERRAGPPLKRTRAPTARIVRPLVRPSLVPLRVRAEQQVHVPVNGLPDPAEPPELRRRRLVEDDPYAPLGLKVGSLVVYPAIQQSLGYDTNPSRVQPGAKGSAVSRTDGELKFRSDWSVHELTGELRAGYSLFPGLREADRPDGDGNVRLRLDATRDTAFEFEGRYRIDSQRPGSPDLNVAVVERPITAVYGGSAGINQRFNRLIVNLRGNVDREVYEDARLTDGTVLRQNDRDTTQFGLRLRTGYEIQPGFTPFVDTLIDTRVHDLAVDYSGYRRDSDGIGVKAGTTFEISRILTGEVSGGVQRRRYDDPRLRDLKGPLLDGALAWAATPLTTVRLRGGTSVAETSIQGASGILGKTGTLEVQHELRRNVTVTLAATLLRNDYQGAAIHEEGYGLSAKVDYRLTRWLALRASFLHENLKSNVPFGGYTANVFLLGMRFNP